MPLLQPRLNLKVSQRQILTPGLMQMVSVLALNKLELTEMINAEMVENPVLEEIDESVPTFDEIGGREALLDRVADRAADRVAEAEPTQAKDPFEEIDFGSYFQEYLDPGFKTSQEYEELDRPTFDQFLSSPTTLTDHLLWQLGALNLSAEQREAAEFLIGNLDENGYLASSLEELATVYAETIQPASGSIPIAPPRFVEVVGHLSAALKVVQHLDPSGVGARDLSECLLIQLKAQSQELALVFGLRSTDDSYARDVETETLSPHHGLQASADALLARRRQSFFTAQRIVERHLTLLSRRDSKEIARAVSCSVADVDSAIELIRTLDPRPGRRYGHEQARLIEPDVAFVKRGDSWSVVMNEENMPSLRLSHRYRHMLVAETTDQDVKDYVKERFRSAMQLMRNIAQRKSTILRTCEVIVRRQQDLLELGVEAQRPMMIKDVAEEIGVHPSTVSRAVANKYAHTPQGVIELRAFFSEGSNGPEGADTPLVVLKRKVRKMIEEEDARRPLTDDQLAAMLQAQGIQVTRRTVAKYREDMQIPSTHQRRRR
uniref:Sigma N (Sigma 54) factor of RNA polymerase n=1 Tax=mine drainage metagenome TaxID=410659 RepID=E6PZC8_9ZZZZ